MVELVTRMEQHTERQPPTVVIQGTTWWAAALEDVPLQEGGLGVPLLVGVCCYTSLSNYRCIFCIILFNSCKLWCSD